MFGMSLNKGLPHCFFLTLKVYWKEKRSSALRQNDLLWTNINAFQLVHLE